MQDNLGNTNKARLFFTDGRIEHYDDEQLAYRVWLAIDKRVGVAFRGAGDTRPVYSGDYAHGR